MTREPFDFWQDHSIKFLEMAFKSDRMEPPADPDGEGRHTGACGDTVAIFLKLRDASIAQVAIQVQGCMNTVACANALEKEVPKARLIYSSLRPSLLLKDKYQTVSQGVRRLGKRSIYANM